MSREMLTKASMLVLGLLFVSILFQPFAKQLTNFEFIAFGSKDETQQDGIFTPVTTRTIVNATMLREITHAIDTEGINDAHVLDWSEDGKHILFQFHDYSKMGTWGPAEAWTLALLDLSNDSEIQTLDIEMKSKPSQYYPDGYLLTIYQAKFSSSGDSIYYLIGGSNPENRYSEDIYKYDIRTGTNERLTTSSNIAWFEITRAANDTLAYITHHDVFHFYPQDDLQLSAKLRDLMVTNNMEPLIDKFAISSDATLFAFPTLDGIKYINVVNDDVRTIVPRTCISSMAFSPNSEFLIYSPRDDRNCEKGENHVLRVVPLEGNHESGELVYMDNWGWLDTVVSPDGAYLATNAQGSDERTSGQGDQTDINPRIVTIQLARPVPEFNSGMIILVVGLLAAATAIIASRTHHYRL
jgi:WD40 repeat protein